MCSLGGKV